MLAALAQFKNFFCLVLSGFASCGAGFNGLVVYLAVVCPYNVGLANWTILNDARQVQCGAFA